MPDPKILQIAGTQIARGEQRDVRLALCESYLGDAMSIPLRVIRAAHPGPTVFVCAAVHGDEINGTGIVHDLIFNAPLDLLKGTLILAPVINIAGFEAHERYLPDRRDLNRLFPGSATGSMGSRIADLIIREIVDKCDYGIDLHSAAFQRTNFPNVRADLSVPGARRLAESFGCALIVDGKGPEGSLRREACKRGVPSIILEAGEPWKIEPAVLAIGVRGVRNVLGTLEMLDYPSHNPPYQTRIRETVWVRASFSGILKFHVSPGELVEAGQPVATNYTIFGARQAVLRAPVAGIILSVATMPAVKPGEPVCHVAVPDRSLESLREALRIAEPGLHQQAEDHMRRSIDIVRAPDAPILLHPDVAMDEHLTSLPPDVGQLEMSMGDGTDSLEAEEYRATRDEG